MADSYWCCRSCRLIGSGSRFRAVSGIPKNPRVEPPGNALFNHIRCPDDRICLAVEPLRSCNRRGSHCFRECLDQPSIAQVYLDESQALASVAISTNDISFGRKAGEWVRSEQRRSDGSDIRGQHHPRDYAFVPRPWLLLYCARARGISNFHPNGNRCSDGSCGLEAYAGTEDKHAPFVTKTLRLVALGVLPPAFLLQFLAVPVVGILYGSEYASATGLVVWMAAGAYMISLASVVGFAILGVGDVWSGIGLNAVWGASYVGFAAFLVGGYGSLGLTVAFILAYGCLLGGALWYARRHLRIRGQEVVPPVALGLAILGAGIVMQAYVDDRLRIAVGLTGAGILTLVGWKWLSRQEKAILLAAMKSIRSKVWRPHSDHERSDPK